jgi:hypothetical protein
MSRKFGVHPPHRSGARDDRPEQRLRDGSIEQLALSALSAAPSSQAPPLNLVRAPHHCSPPTAIDKICQERSTLHQSQAKLKRKGRPPASDKRPAVVLRRASCSVAAHRWQAGATPKGRSAWQPRCAWWDDSVPPTPRARCRRRRPPRPCDKHRRSRSRAPGSAASCRALLHARRYDAAARCREAD